MLATHYILCLLKLYKIPLNSQPQIATGKNPAIDIIPLYTFPSSKLNPTDNFAMNLLSSTHIKTDKSLFIPLSTRAFLVPVDRKKNPVFWTMKNSVFIFYPTPFHTAHTLCPRIMRIECKWNKGTSIYFCEENKDFFCNPTSHFQKKIASRLACFFKVHVWFYNGSLRKSHSLKRNSYIYVVCSIFPNLILSFVSIISYFFPSFNTSVFCF